MTVVLAVSEQLFELLSYICRQEEILGFIPRGLLCIHIILRPELRVSWELLSLITSRIKDWAWAHSRKQRGGKKPPTTASISLWSRGTKRESGAKHISSGISVPSLAANPHSTTPRQMAVSALCMVSSGQSKIAKEWAVAMVPASEGCLGSNRRLPWEIPFFAYSFSQLCLHLYGMKVLSFIHVTESFIRAKYEFGEIRGNTSSPWCESLTP